MLQGNMRIDKQWCGRQGTETLASDEGHEVPSPRGLLMAFYATTQYWGEPPSASMGVEGSGAGASGSEKMVKRVKKSIGVLRGE